MSVNDLDAAGVTAKLQELIKAGEGLPRCVYLCVVWHRCCVRRASTVPLLTPRACSFPCGNHSDTTGLASRGAAG